MSDVLIAGAGGYIGSRLVPELVAAGYAVRAGFRDPRAARRFAWYTDVEVVRLDVREPALLAAAVRDVRSVYYLVHAMADRDCERLDRLAAQAVARAAARPTWTGSSTSPG